MLTETTLAASLARLAPRIGVVSGGVEALRRLSGGASQETWSFDLTHADGVLPLILRRMPEGERHGAYAAGPELEAIVINRARQAGVPAPAIRHVLEPADGTGRGFIMDRVEGETLGSRIVRSDSFKEARARFAEQAAEILARVHALSPAGLPITRIATPKLVIDELESLLRTLGAPRPVFQAALHWLRQHAPAPVAIPAVLHGDFRTGNLIFGPDGIRAVIDWELLHLGDPLEDLGWLRVGSWRFGALDQPFGGIAPEQAFLSAYEASSGRPVDRQVVRFWEAVGSLRWGVMCATMVNWIRSGQDRSVERMMIARRASEAEIDLLNLLKGAG